MYPEKRQSPRHPSDHVFRATHYLGGEIPSSTSFQSVEAYDLSRDGIALITDRFGVGEAVMLLLEPPDLDPVMVVGEVRHVTAMRFNAVFLPVTGIGFTERISDDMVSHFTESERANRPAHTVDEKLW